jgi:hypothetical protein
MPRKRAPGAGRKPRGEFKGKTATLTTRITPETRAALERAAKKRRRSLSQEVEHRLYVSIRRDYEHKSHRHILGLAEAIALLTHWVEARTQKRWIDDPFTGEALRRAIESFVVRFGAPGAPEIPASVKEAWARMLPTLPYRDQFLTPTGVGHDVANHLISWIEHLGRDRLSGPLNLHTPDQRFDTPGEWYLYSQLSSDLEFSWVRRQKLMRKEGSR